MNGQRPLRGNSRANGLRSVQKPLRSAQESGPPHSHVVEELSEGETRMARNVTGWVGWGWFAAFSILAVGLFNIVAGVAAAFSPNNVLSWTNNGVAVVDVSTWGWVHIILGALLVA